MSSPYPVLNNRPLDQWKVTELKEELRRRKLPISGLKENLIKRLSEALNDEQQETAASDGALDDGINPSSDQQDDAEGVANDEAANMQKENPLVAVDRNKKLDNDNPEVVGVSSENADQNTKFEDETETKVEDVQDPVPVKTVEIPVKTVEDSSIPVKHDGVATNWMTKDESSAVSGLKENLINRVSEALDDEQLEAPANDGALDNGITPVSDQQGDAEGAANDVTANLQKKNLQVAVDRNKILDNDSPEVVGISSENANQNTRFEDEAETKVEDDQDPVTVKIVEDPVSVKTAEDSSVPVKHDGLASNLITKDKRSSVKEDNLEPISGSMKHSDAESMIESRRSNPLELNDRMYEISTDLGFHEKCESITADSASINEKNELKDSFIADNVPIEIDANSETMRPSSRNTFLITGEELKLNKEPDDNLVSLPEIDVTYPNYVDLTKKVDSDDGGSPEKLNFDRSSGDELMEEDVLDKHVNSSNDLDEMEEKTEINKVHVVDEKAIGDIMVDELSSKKKHVAEGMKPAASAEKRKLEEPENVQTNEAPKKQRRWNSETIKVPTIENPMLISSGAPRDTALRAPGRVFSRSNSGASADTPTERVVPPSQKAATTSLRIDRFLRPFTLKAVQELLAKTGNVSAFWMDNIKTHCYVTYSSVEEAVATRNALYNLQWPPNGGRQLIANFVEAEEVKARLEDGLTRTPAPATPMTATPPASAIQNIQPFPQPHQQPPQPSNLPPPPPPPHQNTVVTTKERLGPPLPEKAELPPVTLDDLFKKTKATPRIYYLPLSEEQVAAKLSAQGHRRKIN